jgi:hypothetical protein
VEASACQKRGVDPPIATGRQRHGKPPPAIHWPIPQDLDAKAAMARKLRMKAGRKINAKRKTVVEPMFGQTKQERGPRRFLLRSLETTNRLLNLAENSTSKSAELRWMA